MQTKPTKGEVNLYNKLKGGTVRALLGKTSAGDGWRPVCAGIYLGNQCSTTEKAAITYGQKFVEQLKQKIEAQQMPVITQQPEKKKRTRRKGEGNAAQPA
jgi:hypothetical protein